jgi:hypothetical protein
MVYLAELAYFEQKDFPLRQAVLVTAVTVASWCRYYHARILAPRPKSFSPTERSGVLPEAPSEKEAFVQALVAWLLDQSLCEDLFYLLLDDNPLPSTRSPTRFAYYDTTSSWVLDLSPEAFALLQARWQEQGLPTDLFYPETEVRCVPYPGQGFVPALLRRLGVQKCYTPRQWQNEPQARTGQTQAE